MFSDFDAGKIFGQKGKCMRKELLKIEGLYKDYDGTSVLEDISISVKEGEVLCVVGPSGCGKSTLLRCINALEPISSGKILLDGDEVEYGSKKLPALRRRIGMVFQSYELFGHKTVLDNMILAPVATKTMSKDEAKEKAFSLLSRVKLSDKADSFPRQLSGGQKQRVAIVRSLMMQPKVLLLDEITAALDPEMVREVLDVVMELADEGKTMIIVTHEMSFARAIADRILFLDEHHLIADMDPVKFFAEPESERIERFLKQFKFERRLGVL